MCFHQATAGGVAQKCLARLFSALEKLPWLSWDEGEEPSFPRPKNVMESKVRRNVVILFVYFGSKWYNNQC